MMMFLGSALFALFFLLLAPGPRAFMVASLASGSAWLWSWAPLSFILVAIVIAAPIIAIHMIRSWPAHVEPENPMAKYRREPVYEDD